MNAAGQSRERWAFWAKAQSSAFCGVLRGVASLLAEKWWKVLLTAAILVVLAPAAVHYTAWALRRLVLTAKVVCAWWIAQVGSVQGVSELLWPYQYVAILMLVCVLAWGVYRTISSWLPERWKGLDGNGCQQGLSQPDQAWKPGSPDRLTRGDFVRVLKLLIRNAPRSEGAQYIGLYGTWGDGKTSVINMLKDRSRAWPFVFVDFSPWDRAGSLSYAAALFDAIAAQMPFRLVDPIRRLLRRFGRLVSVKGERRLGGWAIEFVVDVFGWIAGSALDVKKQLVERLDKSGRRIVVIIDDVDRLPPKDVYELIRVIKANGDLPNVTYLLAADKTYLATALATVLQFPGDAVEEGRRYLEKIIQVECPLPSNDRADIEQELLERAREVPRRYIHGVAELKDGDIADVVPLVKNLRQVSRVLNVFEVDVAMQSRKHGMRSSMDVHLGDLLALSVLKVYCPDFVSRLHSAFDSWVYQSTHGQSDAAGRSSDWVNMTLIGDVPVELRNVLLTVLEKRLRMKNRKGGQKGDEERFVLEDSASSEGLRDFRLFSRFAFENYFSSKKNQALRGFVKKGIGVLSQSKSPGLIAI